MWEEKEVAISKFHTFQIKPFKIKRIVTKSSECKFKIFCHKMRTLAVVEHVRVY